MRGFTERALILLSSYEAYEMASSVYKYDYRKAVGNVISYLKSRDVEHDCLITDPLATHIDMSSPRWIATGAREDMFFLTNFCGVPTYDVVALDDRTAGELRKKFPLERGMTREAQANMISKRIAFMEKEIPNHYKFVVVFGKQFRVKSKEGDGRAVLYVGEKKFNPSLFLSGSEVDINSFLQEPYTNLCVNNWR